MFEVDLNIRAQYHQGTHCLSQQDHTLFTLPLTDILSASIIYWQRWLAGVETARERALRRLAVSFSAEQHVLLAWLPCIARHPGGWQ
jgi:hypothetical protein